jgi:hypothetical protein
MHLSELAQIQSGYTIRSPLSPDEAGVPVAQVRDIGFDGADVARVLQRFRIEGAYDRYLIGPGDVVFRSRGERTTAVALGPEFKEAAVAVLPLIILRPDQRTITPEYLAWAINQPRAQLQLDAGAQGTNLRMVPKSALEMLDIDVPPLETQSKIMATHELAEQELALSRTLASLRRDLASRLLAETVDRQALQPPSGHFAKAIRS